MKKSIFSKVGAAAMVLTLVTASLVGGTFAKYTTTVVGTGKATVAKWDVKISKDNVAQTANFDFDLADTSTMNVTDGKLAPGAEGTIELVVNGGTSDIGYMYSAEIDTTNLAGIPIEFYNGADSKPIEITGNKAVIIANKEVALSKVKEDQTISIRWSWPNDTDGTVDTPIGTGVETGTFAVTVSAEQFNGVKSVTP